MNIKIEFEFHFGISFCVGLIMIFEFLFGACGTSAFVVGLFCFYLNIFTMFTVFWCFPISMFHPLRKRPGQWRRSRWVHGIRKARFLRKTLKHPFHSFGILNVLPRRLPETKCASVARPRGSMTEIDSDDLQHIGK
jgi:hypothetical protein